MTLPSDAIVEAFVPSADLARSRAFYEGALGLRVVDDNGFALLLAGSNATIRVTQVAEVTPPGHTVLGWVVADIERTADALLASGVQLVDYAEVDQDDRRIWTTPGGDRVAWFRDPDGSTLSISQRPPT